MDIKGCKSSLLVSTEMFPSYRRQSAQEHPRYLDPYGSGPSEQTNSDYAGRSPMPMGGLRSPMNSQPAFYPTEPYNGPGSIYGGFFQPQSLPFYPARQRAFSMSGPSLNAPMNMNMGYGYMPQQQRPQIIIIPESRKCHHHHHHRHRRPEYRRTYSD